MSQPCSNLLLFGATGDLSKRMLLPSLFGLDADGLLPAGLRIVATARSEMDTAAFRTLAAEALMQFIETERRVPATVERFLARLAYVPLDANQPEGFAALAEAVGDTSNLAIFLSTAPSLFGPTIAGLAGAGLAGRPMAAIIDDGVVVAHLALVIEADGVDHIGQQEGAGLYSGFFQKFAAGAGLGTLAQMLRAAGQGPTAQPGRLAAAGQQNGVTAKNDGADAHPGAGGEFAAGHGLWVSSSSVGRKAFSFQMPT